MSHLENYPTLVRADRGLFELNPRRDLFIRPQHHLYTPRTRMLTLDALEVFVLQLGETVLAFMDYNRWLRKPRLPEAYSGF